MRAQVLLLNQSYEPLNLISFKRAAKMWSKGKIEIMCDHENLDNWREALNAPVVVRMKYFVKISQKPIRDVVLTRRNIWERDNGKCQYCNSNLSLNKLTFDHVIPRILGGKTTWTNIVSACQKCNTRKGGRTPEQAGMVLLSTPGYPSSNPISVERSVTRRIMHDIKTSMFKSEWQEHIYWNVELDEM